MEATDCRESHKPLVCVSPSLRILLPACRHTHTVHLHTDPNHQSKCDIRDLTKTSWPSRHNFNKLQLRADTVSVCNAPAVTQGSPCVCVPTHFLFLRGTPSAHRTGQLTVGGNWACSTNRKEKKIKHLNGNQLHLLLIEPQLHPLAPRPSIPLLLFLHHLLLDATVSD